MRKVLIGRAMAAAGLTLCATMAMAQYGGSEGQVTNFFNQATTWTLSYLGPFVLGLGIIIWGLSLAAGNERGVEKGYAVLGGGVLIFLSQGLVALLKRLSGTF